MNAVVEIDMRLLPPTIKRMVRVIGIEMTLKLLRHQGGTDLRLPYGVTRRRRHGLSDLAQILNHEQIHAFYGEFADGRKEMTLPKADKIVMQYRNAEIRRLHGGDGISLPVLALRFELTERQVWNIVHSETWPRWRSAETMQQELFDTPD